MQIHKGSCLCKQITFEVIGSFDSFYLCHCKYCQKDTGSAHAANLFSSNAKLSWLSGKEKISNYKLPNTKHTKSFCQICSSALPNLQMNDKLLVVPASSLDTRLNIEPNAHLFYSSKAEWDNNLEKIKKFDSFPYEKK